MDQGTRNRCGSDRMAALLADLGSSFELKRFKSKKYVQEIDLGLNDFIITSDGERVKAPQYLREAEGKLTREQRTLSRKQEGSSRYRKQRLEWSFPILVDS